MKWFKHDSNASEDIKIQKLMEKYGIAGYAYYFTLIELCARSWKPGAPPIFHFTPRQIFHLWRTKPSHGRHVLVTLSDVGGIQITSSDLEVRIEFPKLLEIKDNYTKDLQDSCKKLAPRGEKEKEKENIVVQENNDASANADQEATSLKRKKADWSTYRQMVGLWNSNCDPLPKLTYTPKVWARSSARARYESSSPEVIVQMIKFAAADPYLSGKTHHNFILGFEEFVKPERFSKLMAQVKNVNKNKKTTVETIEVSKYEGK